MSGSQSYPFWVRDKKHAWLAAKSKAPADKKGRVKMDIVNRSGAASQSITIKEIGALKWDPQDKSRDGKPNWVSADPSHFADGVRDIATLANMNEAAMIDVLRRRFADGKIYTQVSDILIVVNPYTFIDGLYDIGPPSQYKLHDSEPHIYVTAESVFTCMMSGDSSQHLNQSVIVSGESGAGKTEACKSVMRYLAARSHTVTSSKRRASMIVRRASEMQRSQASTANIEQRVLACNPFLEAFGNAKTLMNDNSSRFGKFLRILYREGHIVGASMETYLLEKGRIVGQGPMERGYHIFYQMCQGLTSAEKSKLGLQKATAYKMLIQGGTRAVNVDSIDDAKDFREARAAMTTVGIDSSQQWELFQILAGLLELNNVEWKSTGRGSTGATVKGVPSTAVMQAKVANKAVLAKAAELLGLRADSGPLGLEYQLSMRMNDSASKTGSVIYRALDPVQCRDAIAALTKHTYSIVFDWLIVQINDRLKPELGDDPQSYIGILDIFGFEIFEHNSFEQLCINFANEKLQRLFQTHVFENEQKMYKAEGIPLHHLKFKSNVHCIALIEGRDAASGYQGILHVLDEFSKTERDIDTDATYAALVLRKFGGKATGTKPSGKAAKMYAAAGQYIEFPKFPPVEWFRINHFAGPVKYEFANFLEKNRDKTFVHLKQMMAKSKRPFIAKLFKTLGGGGRQKKKREVATIAGKFIKQLQGLTKTVLQTRNHYVRCVKPNDSKLAYNQGGAAFEAPKVLRQLLYAGVMATIEIRQAGFPYRESLESFWARSIKNKWHILAKVEESVGARKGIQAILDKVQADMSLATPLAMVGVTRVFGKDNLIAGVREWHQTKVIGRLLAFSRGKLERLMFLKRWEEKMKRKYAKNYMAKVLGRAAAACAYVQRLREKFQAELEAARAEEARRVAAIAAEQARLEAEARAERERLEALARSEAEAQAAEEARLQAQFEAEQLRSEQLRLAAEAEAQRARRQAELDGAVNGALDAAFAAIAMASELARVGTIRAQEAAERRAAELAAIEKARIISLAADAAVEAARAAAASVDKHAQEAMDVVKKILARAAAAEAEMRRIQEKTDAAMREAELLGRSPFSVLDKTVFNMQNSVYRYTLGSNLNRPADRAPTAAVPEPQWLISAPGEKYPEVTGPPPPSSLAIANLEKFASSSNTAVVLASSSPKSPFESLAASAASAGASLSTSPYAGMRYASPSTAAPAVGSGWGVGRDRATDASPSRVESWQPYQFSASKVAVAAAPAPAPTAVASPSSGSGSRPTVHVSRKGSVNVYIPSGQSVLGASVAAKVEAPATPPRSGGGSPSTSPTFRESPRFARLRAMERMIAEQEAELQQMSRHIMSSP